MKEIKVVNMVDDFTCSCGNTSFKEGFFPCDEKGVLIEPLADWKGHYACARCQQVYFDKNISEEPESHKTTLIDPRKHSYAFRLGMRDCFKVLTGKCSLSLTEEEYKFYQPLTKEFGDGSADYCRTLADQMAENDSYTEDTGILAHMNECGHISFSDGQHRTCIAKKEGQTELAVTLTNNEGCICRVCHFKKEEAEAPFLTKLMKRINSNREDEMSHLEFIDDELKDYFWKGKKEFEYKK